MAISKRILVLAACIALTLTSFGAGVFFAVIRDGSQLPFLPSSSKPRDLVSFVTNQTLSPCQAYGVTEKSDDCAQWRATIASEKSAQWSLWQMWLTAFGSFGLAITLWFNFRALRLSERESLETKNALTFAETNANAAADLARFSREAHEADLRAWLSIEVGLEQADRKPDGILISGRIKITNVGKTPALSVGVDLHGYIMPTLQVGYGEPPDLSRRIHSMPAVMPQGSQSQGIGIRLDLRQIAEGNEKCRKIGCHPVLYIDAFVSYRTVFDRADAPLHVTSIRYLIVPKWQPLTTMDVKLRWLDNGPFGADSVVFSQVNSAPIHVT